MKYLLLFISSMISYGITYLLADRFRSWIPKGKGFDVGSAFAIGIIILFFTIEFFYPSVHSDYYYGIGCGLAVGLGHGITFNDRKHNKTKII